jgi:hypothetical protein
MLSDQGTRPGRFRAGPGGLLGNPTPTHSSPPLPTPTSCGSCAGRGWIWVVGDGTGRVVRRRCMRKTCKTQREPCR